VPQYFEIASICSISVLPLNIGTLVKNSAIIQLYHQKYYTLHSKYLLQNCIKMSRVTILDYDTKALLLFKM
jgi:hypothetical protein